MRYLVIILLKLILMPSSAAADESDMIWKLHLKANSHFIIDTHGNPIALRLNYAARKEWKLLHK